MTALCAPAFLLCFEGGKAKDEKRAKAKAKKEEKAGGGPGTFGKK